MGLGRYLDTRRSRVGPNALSGSIMRTIMESSEGEYTPKDLQQAIHEKY